ncbi:toll-like receptor 2 [Xenopus laevis]|uniref:TIR domain-containing protein n=2 Tax=Xenopus laevis TaxID=8355 RepID=A0A974H990_XENLA|nr:toll-like receptor 2 [Xenopus laevis]OCT69484.1 hypothetical protein XELAEV_18040795mg [Xenopus laevis]
MSRLDPLDHGSEDVKDLEMFRHYGEPLLYCLLLLALVKGTWSQNPCQVDHEQKYANCQGLNLNEVPEDLPITLEELDLSCNWLYQIKFDDFSSYTNLRALNLSFNNISTIENDSFALNTLLRNLTLFNNSLTEVPSVLLEPLLLLESLDLSNNLYNYSTLGKVFKTLVNLQSLSIGGPFVSKVLKGDFVPIKNISLQTFSLKTKCSLVLYQSGAFSVLNTNILTLDIALDTNAKALLLILKDLAGKSLDRISFWNLFEYTYYAGPTNLFSGLPDINIRELVFYGGKVNEKLLQLILESIQTSSIQNLLLLSIDFDYTLDRSKVDVKMDNLFLKNLVIKDVKNPDILTFDRTFTWFGRVRNLYIINVNFNFVQCDAWSQMENVERLDISNNLLLGSYLYNPLCKYSELPKLRTFTAKNNNLQSLKPISLLTASWPKLATLDLSSNYLGSQYEDCRWTPNITTLILKYNILSVGVFTCLPTTVQYLDLSYSHLEWLNMDYFNNATNLKKLILSYNKLTLISSDWRNPHLQVLSLDGNIFSVIDKGSFNNLPQLRTLTAGDNPYHCTCDLYAFFSDILSNSKVSLADWPQAYYCYHPQQLRGTRVNSYTPGSVECDVRLLVAITVSTTAVVVIFCMILCWRFDAPWYFRMTCHIVKSKYRSRKANDGKEYLYHAFVSYCHSDADWVRGELLYRLESCSPPYRVCIHERDFLPGRWIIDNIIDNIENSRKTIFVLSHNFVNSEWCNYELYFAHQRAISHSFEDVILVVKENVTLKDLPKRFYKLRKMLRKKTYLEWPSELSKQHFFWIQLKNILGSPSNGGQEGLSVVDETVAPEPCPVSEIPPIIYSKMNLPGS